MLPRDEILLLTRASTLERIERVQTLWSGYGEIVRVRLDGAPAIVKLVSPPTAGDHPRGWNTDRSHERKLRSYAVELAWYRDWSRRCADACRVAETIATAELEGGGWLFVLEDLDAAGYPERRSRLDRDGVVVCLKWLAEFHATFLGESPDGLWPTGTYWHLDTRPDEWAAMPEGELKAAAKKIDARLGAAHFQTFVHGDAKIANFCFSRDAERVAAVDFQYVGGGCGMKDVAYFLGSCLTERECERDEGLYLDAYFHALGRALVERGRESEAAAVESEWRELFPVAWADFHRFLVGWSPGHPKMTGYSERLVREVLARFV